MSLPAINIKLAADLTDFLKSMDLAQRTFKKVGDDMMQMGKTMSTYVTAPLAGLAAVSLKAAGDMEALKNGLASVTKAGESVNKEMTKLREVAKLPGLGLKEVVQGSINLQAIGVSADDARKAMLAFGNAIASVGGGKDNFDLAIRGFSQLRNAAKPLQQDLYQIANQLPQVNSLLIEAFGTSRAEDLAAMGISGKQLADFLVEGLGKLPKVTGGINNAFENLKDIGFNALATLGDAINKNFGVEELLNKIANAIGRMVSAFENLSPGMQKIVLGFGALLIAVGPLLTALGFLVSNILPLLKTGLTVISAIFSPMGLTIMAVVAAVAAVAYSARLIVDNWGVIVNFFSRTWAQIKIITIDALLWIANATAGDWAKLMLDALIWPFKKWLEFATVYINKIIEAVKYVFGGLGEESKKSGELVNKLSKETKESTKSISQSLLEMKATAQKTLDSTPVTTFGDVFSGMANTMKSDLKSLMDWFNGTGKEAEKMGQKVQNALGKANGGGKPMSKSEEKDVKKTTRRFKSLKKLPTDSGKELSPVVAPEVDTSSLEQAASVMRGYIAEYKSMVGEINNVVSKTSQYLGQVVQGFSNITQLSYQKANAEADNYYASEKSRIDSQNMSQDQRAAAMAALDQEVTKRKNQAAKKQAEANKKYSIVSAVVNTAEAVSKALTAGPILGPVLAAVVGGLGAAQIGIIASTPIPALAQGGLAYGPTMAMVGDNKNAHIDPEVVAPLSKLKGMIGGNNQAVQVVGNFRVQGPDLLLAIKNAEMRERGNS